MKLFSKRGSAKTAESRRKKGKLKTVLCLLCAIGVIVGAVSAVIALILNARVCAASEGRILSPQEAAALNTDCILVLGAGVRDDGTPSHMLQDRLLTGIELYELGAAPKLLMSGDHGQAEYDEVNVMKAFATDAGIPSGDVFMDHAGFSTYESLYRARDVFCAERVIIVTQEYHLHRALYIAQSLGIEAWGVKADLRTYAGQGMRELREIAARAKDVLWCALQPAPTYLGDDIPVSGNGDLTNDK